MGFLKYEFAKKRKNHDPELNSFSVQVYWSVHANLWIGWTHLGSKRTWLGHILFMLDARASKCDVSLLFSFFSFILALLLTLNLDFVYTNYKIGDLATTDIKSPLTFEFTDEVDTANKKTWGRRKHSRNLWLWPQCLRARHQRRV